MAERRSPEQWNEIRDRYVMGEVVDGSRAYPTLDDIAEAEGLNPATVRKRAASEDWQQQRNVFATKVSEQREAKVADELAKSGAKFDTDNLKLARALQGQIAKVIKPHTEDKGAAMKVSTISTLAGALAQVQRVGRLALGDSTDNMRLSGGEELRQTLEEARSRIRSIRD